MRKTIKRKGRERKTIKIKGRERNGRERKGRARKTIKRKGRVRKTIKRKGRERVDLLGDAMNIGVEGGKDFFVLLGIVMIAFIWCF